MFTVRDRDCLRDYVLQLAASDARVVAGAVVGSLALDQGDRWSDLDLTFAVADDQPLQEVLADWTGRLVMAFDAAHLFDLSSGASLYRVFLLPNCLQVDLSFTPAAQFGATGPRFRLLFGQRVEKPYPQLPSARELFGYAIHHALRARFCIERGRYWNAEYWISSTRDYALSLACLRLGHSAFYGRGFDNLPAEMLNRFSATLVTSLEKSELLRALSGVIEGLLHEGAAVPELVAQVEPQLRQLAVAWDHAEREG